MPHRISGGERQRCAICQNLAREPQFLLLDEPFSSLDVETRRKLRNELKRLNKTMSLPMIHVTHELGEALFLGDQILSVVRGKLESDWFERQLHELRQEVVWENLVNGRPMLEAMG
jgi:molybdate transport system ATP-binding protein